MRKWISKPTGYSPIMDRPLDRYKGGIKLMDLNPNTVVNTVDSAVVNGYERVTYTVGNKTFDGWVDSSYIEPYYVNLPENIVDLSGFETPEDNDPAQYGFWKSRKQVNMCGELCCAYLLKCSLDAVLTVWEKEKPSIFKRIFASGSASGTYNTDLQAILEAFGRKAELITTKTNPYYTPQVVDNLKGSIVGVKLDTRTGRLNGGGVGHWVVIDDILLERSGGVVTIYDPFMYNGITQYSYNEFLNSARQPFGVRMIK